MSSETDLEPRGAWRRIVRRLVRGALFVYLGSMLVMVVLQDVLLFPGLVFTNVVGSGPVLDGFERRTTESGVTVWEDAEEFDRVVVLAHGNGERASDVLGYGRALNEVGWRFVVVEYRGFDGAPGWPGEQRLADDFRSVLDDLHAEGMPYDRMVVHARSIGGGVAIGGAYERPIAGFVLESTFDSVVDVASRRFPTAIFPVRWLLWNRFDNRARLRGLGIPVFQVHDRTDAVIPMARGRSLNDSLVAGTWMETDGFPHGSPLVWMDVEVRDRWFEWLEERVQTPGR